MPAADLRAAARLYATGGDAAILYCFVFLYLVFAGPGEWSLDALRNRDAAFKGLVADEISATVWPFVEGGRLKPEIDSVFPLAQAADAHRRLEEDHVGKVVLTM